MREGPAARSSHCMGEDDNSGMEDAGLSWSLLVGTVGVVHKLHACRYVLGTDDCSQVRLQYISCGDLAMLFGTSFIDFIVVFSGTLLL